MAYNNSYLIKIFERIKEFSFSSRSLENSEMNWNYTGTGKTKIVSKITSDKNEFYFFDRIFIENSYDKDNNLILKDRKLWCINGNSIEFYHFRNSVYEKIFKFLFLKNKFVLNEEYFCNPDIYSGDIQIFDYGISFSITIKGKRKNELIEYIYYVDNY